MKKLIVCRHLYPGYFAPNEGCQVRYRKHTDAQIERLIDEVENFVGIFSAINSNDVYMLVEVFCEKLYDIYDRSFPIVTKTLSEKRIRSPWITRSLLDSIDRKNFLYREYKRGNIDRLIYNNYRNLLSSSIKKAKEQYYGNLFREANDARLVWKNINKVLGRSRRSQVDIALNINGAVVNA